MKNRLASPDSADIFDSIVIVTDRDELDTEKDFIEKITQTLQEYQVQHKEVVHNYWIECMMKSAIGLVVMFRFLLLVVPFEEKGAMETFLLNAVAKENEYDKVIIEKCNGFVEQIDPEKRYLVSRRHITKAKFDTYFSVRTAAEQFNERQNILKNVSWEEYSAIQDSFYLLSEL